MHYTSDRAYVSTFLDKKCADIRLTSVCKLNVQHQKL